MSYLPKKFQTSFMDIILGTLGAFFLLLIIISTNRRGIQESGSKLPGNILSISIVDDSLKSLRFYKDIGFWIAIEENDQIEGIWYSDEQEKVNDEYKNLIELEDKNRDVTSRFSTILRVSDENRSKVIIGFWLRELPTDFSAQQIAKVLKDGIEIQVLWNRKTSGNDPKNKIVLNAKNHFQTLPFQPGTGFKENLIKNVAYEKPKSYISFPYFNPKEELIKYTQRVILSINSETESTLCFVFGENGKSARKDIYDAPLYHHAFYKQPQGRNRIPVYISKKTAEFSVQGCSSELSVLDVASNQLHLLDEESNSKIKSMHFGSRAIVLILEDNSMMYHLMTIAPEVESKQTKKDLEKYPYRSWKAIFPSPSDGESAKWETISSEDVKELKKNYSELGEDFIYAFAEILAEPMPDRGTAEEALPFRRNPMIDLWAPAPSK